MILKQNPILHGFFFNFNLNGYADKDFSCPIKFLCDSLEIILTYGNMCLCSKILCAKSS